MQLNSRQKLLPIRFLLITYKPWVWQNRTNNILNVHTKVSPEKEKVREFLPFKTSMNVKHEFCLTETTFVREYNFTTTSSMWVCVVKTVFRLRAITSLQWNVLQLGHSEVKSMSSCCQSSKWRRVNNILINSYSFTAWTFKHHYFHQLH